MEYKDGKFYHKRGNVLSLEIYLYDENDDLITNLATAESVVFQIKRSRSSTVAAISKSSALGEVLVNNPTVGAVSITVDSDDMEDLDLASYYPAVQVNYTSTRWIEPDLTFNVNGEYVDFDRFRITRDVIT
jgi:hypothetical protein